MHVFRFQGFGRPFVNLVIYNQHTDVPAQEMARDQPNGCRCCKWGVATSWHVVAGPPLHKLLGTLHVCILKTKVAGILWLERAAHSGRWPFTNKTDTF
jgi:hypothetical protein